MIDPFHFYIGLMFVLLGFWVATVELRLKSLRDKHNDFVNETVEQIERIGRHLYDKFGEYP